MGEDLIPIKKENYEGHMLDCCSDGQHYPYGTSLHVEDDLIDTLGVAELATEDVVEIRTVGFINSKHENSRSGGENSKSIGIQLTGLKIKRKSEDVDAVKTLYGG